MTDQPDDEFTVHCPKCGKAQQDFDGFGVLFCEACRYCQHPGGTGIAGGGWVCDLCGRTVIPLPDRTNP